MFETEGGFVFCTEDGIGFGCTSESPAEPDIFGGLIKVFQEQVAPVLLEKAMSQWQLVTDHIQQEDSTMPGYTRFTLTKDEANAYVRLATNPAVPAVKSAIVYALRNAAYYSENVDVTISPEDAAAFIEACDRPTKMGRGSSRTLLDVISAAVSAAAPVEPTPVDPSVDLTFSVPVSHAKSLVSSSYAADDLFDHMDVDDDALHAHVSATAKDALKAGGHYVEKTQEAKVADARKRAKYAAVEGSTAATKIAALEADGNLTGLIAYLKGEDVDVDF